MHGRGLDSKSILGRATASQADSIRSSRAARIPAGLFCLTSLWTRIPHTRVKVSLSMGEFPSPGVKIPPHPGQLAKVGKGSRHLAKIQIVTDQQLA